MVSLGDCVDPRYATEFERWQQEEFMPHIEAVPCVTHVHRYETAYRDEPTFRGHPRYLTIAEVEHEDIQEARRELRAVYDRVRKELDGREIRKLDTVYERVGDEFRSERSGRPVKHVYCGLVGCTDTRREGEWNRWYESKHLPDALRGTFDTGYRYRVVAPTDPAPHQAPPYLSLYEAGYDFDELQQRLASFRAELLESDQVWRDLLAIHYSGLFAPVGR
jgi:hypothetical protein